MSPTAVWNFIQWLHYLALSVWIGGIFFVAAIVRPAAHRSMASKAVAGQIVGSMLRRLNAAELAAAVVLLITSFSSFRLMLARKDLLWVIIAIILIMAAVTSIYAFLITPRMELLKEKTPTLDALSPTHAAKLEFDRLHRIYVRLMSFNLVLGLLVLYGSVVILK